MSGARAECRPAGASDSSDLAILADAATRRLISWIWNEATEAGQSAFEVGRNTIHSNTESLSHFSHWRVAERDGVTLGAINSYLLTPDDGAGTAASGEVLVPLNELKATAAGTWYVSVASVFPEARSQGFGHVLLADAAERALAAGASRLTLIVASFNPDAQRLYARLGFDEWERRPFHTFPGSDAAGDWILMAKDLDQAGTT